MWESPVRSVNTSRINISVPYGLSQSLTPLLTRCELHFNRTFATQPDHTAEPRQNRNTLEQSHSVQFVSRDKYVISVECNKQINCGLFTLE